ncbi:MAG: metallophosphoesterase [Rhizobiaceae bacterium]
MFRLAHVSDIHLSPLPDLRKRDLASKRITGYLNWRFNRKKTHAGEALKPIMDDIRLAAPDHIAVTGDLVNLALGPEFAATRHWLESIGEPFDVSVVPGNHDAYVPGALAKACQSWTEYMTGDVGLKGAVPTPETLFPYLRQRGPVALIGVSSAVASAPFLATGRFRADEAEQLAVLLRQAKDSGLFRVVMIHHPPFRFEDDASRRLYGIRLFQKTVLEAGAELVLHGHTHLNSYRLIGKGESGIPVIGVPSASQGVGGRKPAARWNQFTISGEAGAWACSWSERGIVGAAGGISAMGERMIMTGSKTAVIKYP